MSDQKMQECFELFYALKWEKVNDFEQNAWKAAWMASRECLVIELPDFVSAGLNSGGWPIDSGADRINSTIKQCKKAIHAAGVKTK